MPGLFDALKRGAIDLFSGGPPVPGVEPGTGSRQGLITAGLNILGAETEDPLEALAIGATAGRQAGQMAREQRKQMMTREAISQFVQQAGFDREGLTRAFFMATGAGDFELAIPLGEIIKSMPRPPEPARSRLQEPKRVVREDGTEVFASFNPDTGQFEEVPSFTPPPEQERFGLADARKVKDEASPTGWSWVGFDRALGVERTIPGAPPPSGSSGRQGTAQEAVTRVRAESVLRDVDTAFSDPGLRTVVGAVLSDWATQGGTVLSTIANWGLGKFKPDTQVANSARDRVAAMVQNIMSGATMADSERRYYRRAYTPAGGGTEESSEQKRAAVVFMMTKLAELGLDPSVTNFETLTDEQKAQVAGIVRQAGAATGVPAFNPFIREEDEGN